MGKIAKITASSAKKYYYEKDPIFNENGDGENLQWLGVGAEALGLEGKIDRKEFSNILDGKSADGSATLRDKSHTTGESVDAYDLVFSAPKSVSILAIGAGDKDVINSHDKAVVDTLKFIEDNFTNTQKTRTNEDGTKYKEEINNQNLTVALVKHSVSRPDEKTGVPNMHLHTHAVILNQVFDKESGQYRALSAKEMMSKNKLIENFYKSELAKNLVEKGYTLESKSHGFDIKMDQEIINKFSGRRDEIEEKAKKLGVTSEKGKKQIQHDYKSEKSDLTKEELKEKWNDKLIEFNKSFEDLKNEAKTSENEYSLSKKEVLEKTFELMSQTDAAVKEDKLLQAALHVSLGNFTLKELKEELDSVKKIGQKEDSDLKLLDVDKSGQKIFTNKEMYDLERENRNTIKNQEKQTAIMSKDQFEKGLKDFEDKNFKLTDGQRESARAILTGDDKYLAIQGVAGAGKTTMLKAVNHILDHNNVDLEVTLLAPTNKAAQGAIAESKLENGKSFNGSTTAKHILNSESVKDRDNEINESAKKHDQSEINESNNVKSNLKDESKSDKNDAKDESKSETNNKLIKSGFTLKKEDQSELFIKSGSKAFAEKNGQKIISIKKTKDGIQSSSKHKNGRSSIVRGGEFDGAKKVEKWNVKKGTYESTMTFKDGSKFTTKVKSTGKSKKNVIGQLVHSSQKIEKSNHKGDSENYKSTTLIGMTYATKNVKTDWGEQSKKSFDVLKLVSYEKNLVKKFDETSETTKKGLLGFSKTETIDKTINKKGDVTSEYKTTSMSFAGITFHQKIESVDIKKNSSRLKISEKINDKETYKKDVVVDKSLAKSVINKEKSKDEVKSDKSENQVELKNGNKEKLSEKPKQKLIIVDETSMLSQNDFKELNKTLKDGDKLAMMGDTSQLKSVGAGDVFKDIQDHTKTTEMNQSQRQLNKQEQDVAKNVRVDTKEAIKNLEKGGNLHELKSREEMINKAVDAGSKKEVLSGDQFGKKIEKEVDYKSNLMLATTNKTVKELNSKMRDKLHETGQINKNEHVKANVKIPVNMSADKQLLADNFERGQNLKTFKDVDGISKGKEYKIVDVDKTNNKLTLKTQTSKGHDVYAKIDLKDAAGKLQVSKDEKREFSKGDVVTVLSTDKKADLLNSDRGIVTNIDQKNQKITVDFGDRGIKEVDLSKGDKSLDHGFATTTHKSQGMSVNRVQAVADTKDESITKNALHVMLTRQKFSSAVFTTDVEKLKSMTSKDDVKETTLDYNKDEVKSDKTETKDEVKTETKDESKVDKPETKDESKVDKPESKDESKVETKDESKVESKDESKSETKDESKVESKDETKTDKTDTDNTKSFNIDVSSLKDEDIKIDLKSAKIDVEKIEEKQDQSLEEKAKNINVESIKDSGNENTNTKTIER